MNLKLALCTMLTFAAPVYFANAQTSTPSGLEAQRNLDDLASGKVHGHVRTYDNRYSGIKGSPFFLEGWGTATLVINSNLKYEKVALKYNVYDNNLLYKKADGTVMELNANSIDHFILQDSLGLKKYTFKRLPELAVLDKKAGERFNAVLHEGNKTKLLLSPAKSMLKADYKGGYSAGRTHDELLTENVYYLVKSDKSVAKVKLNKKSLLKALENEQQKVQAFMAKEKIDAGTEDGWLKTLLFYESL